MTHRDTRILVVLVLALGSLSTGTAQVPEEIKQINQAVFKILLRELPRRLQCEEGVCTSGNPNGEYDRLRRNGTPIYDCTTQYSNCEVLKLVRGSRWKSNSYQERILVDITQLAKVIARQHEQVLAALQRASDRMDSQPQGGQNATSQLLAELDTLRGRQAASAALQVVQFFLFIGHLLTLATIYVVKQCRMHRERLAEEEVKLIEQKLQERKTKRRVAAAKAKAAPGPSQE